MSQTAAGATPTIGFTGHVNDADTGLVYMQQRYYDPVAGRMLSIDPVTTDSNSGNGFNRYVYANNSPYRYLDPDGREAADKFGDQFKKDAEAGNSAVYKPLVPYAAGATAVMLIVPAASAAIIAGGTTEVVAAGGVAAKGASILAKEEKVAETVVRTTRAGDKAARITKSDGSVVDISPSRVKEYVPNTHPNAPAGALDKVKFENSLPGSKGFKREPTAEELKILKDAK